MRVLLGAAQGDDQIVQQLLVATRALGALHGLAAFEAFPLTRSCSDAAVCCLVNFALLALGCVAYVVDEGGDLL